MKIVYLLMLTSITLGIAGRAAPAQRPSHGLSAAVERAGGKIYLRLTNTDGGGGFKGSAHIRFDGSASSTETPRLSLELAPGETRLFPLDAATPSSDQYMLTIYNQNGAIVLFQAAPISAASKAPAQPTRPAMPVEISIQPRLVRASHYSEAEIPVPEEPDPFILAFDIAVPAPLVDANLAISAKNFEQRQTVAAVAARDRTRVEFRLPDDLSERNLQYLLTDAAGKVLAGGEVNLDHLTMAESVTVSGLKFDRPAYAPGDSARLVIELLGEPSRSYRLEVAAREGDNLIYRDARKGVQPRQEFTFELPSEVKGLLVVEYKVFGAQTGALFDSGAREIALSSATQKKNAGDKARVAP